MKINFRDQLVFEFCESADDLTVNVTSRYPGNDLYFIGASIPGTMNGRRDYPVNGFTLFPKRRSLNGLDFEQFCIAVNLVSCPGGKSSTKSYKGFLVLVSGADEKKIIPIEPTSRKPFQFIEGRLEIEVGNLFTDKEFPNDAPAVRCVNGDILCAYLIGDIDQLQSDNVKDDNSIEARKREIGALKKECEEEKKKSVFYVSLLKLLIRKVLSGNIWEQLGIRKEMKIYRTGDETIKALAGKFGLTE